MPKKLVHKEDLARRKAARASLASKATRQRTQPRRSLAEKAGPRPASPETTTAATDISAARVVKRKRRWRKDLYAKRIIDYTQKAIEAISKRPPLSRTHALETIKNSLVEGVTCSSAEAKAQIIEIAIGHAQKVLLTARRLAYTTRTPLATQIATHRLNLNHKEQLVSNVSQRVIKPTIFSPDRIEATEEAEVDPQAKKRSRPARPVIRNPSERDIRAALELAPAPGFQNLYQNYLVTDSFTQCKLVSRERAKVLGWSAGITRMDQSSKALVSHIVRDSIVHLTQRACLLTAQRQRLTITKEDVTEGFAQLGRTTKDATVY